jgi:hypothetical protein
VEKAAKGKEEGKKAEKTTSAPEPAATKGKEKAASANANGAAANNGAAKQRKGKK